MNKAFLFNQYFFTFSAGMQAGESWAICSGLKAASTGVLLAVRSAALREETLAFQVHLAGLQDMTKGL